MAVFAIQIRTNPKHYMEKAKSYAETKRFAEIVRLDNRIFKCSVQAQVIFLNAQRY
jgi:hypothetical protein